MEYLVVDGYNIINSWTDIFYPDKEPLEDCRVKLLNILSNYQGYRKIKVIVVFDAHFVKGSREKQEVHDNITIIYTKENESADNYIERFVYRFSSDNVIRVATSDYLEQTVVLNIGGIRMSARELREEIGRTVKSIDGRIKKNIHNSNTIMSNIKPELAEILEKMRKDKF